MEKKRILKSTIFVLVLFVIAIIVYFGYYFFSGHENPFLELFSGNKDEDVFIDNKNGFYVYTDVLDQVYNFYSGCHINSIDMEYIVINDTYKLYRTSCLGSFYLDSGKTEDLNIQYDEEKKLFYLEKDGNTYYKKYEVSSLVPGNLYSSTSSQTIDPLYLKEALRETERPGYYYHIKDAKIDGAINFIISVNYEEDLEELDADEMLYTFELKSNFANTREKPAYRIDFPTTIDKLPDVYSYGKFLVVVDPEKVGNHYSYNFRVFDSTGFTYNLRRQFPITVNGYEITTNDNMYVAYISSNRTFKLLVTPNEFFCEPDSDSTDVAYYLFSISYNYLTKEFDPPKFEKIGYKNEGCQTVYSLMGG